MAKSGQYMPHKSQPEHLSAFTMCGGWYPLELYAELSARTLVGQNSTQNPQALHRSTTIDTEPRAIESPFGRSALGTVHSGLRIGDCEWSLCHPSALLSILRLCGPR